MIISGSILSKEKNYKKLIEEFNKTDVDLIHIDVMDGKFVSDKAFTIKEIEEISKLTNKPLDIHLMVKNPIKYIEKLYTLNAKYITFHYETVEHYENLIDKIHNYGINVGVSIKPETNADVLLPILNKIDLVLIMTVNPGKSGQQFMPSNIYKIEMLKKKIKEQTLNTKIEVDGGINDTNKEILKISGADILVSASFLHNENMQDKINLLR